MPTMIQQVPKEIRNHFGSEGTIVFIEEFNKKLGMGYSRFLSRLLSRLMTKDLSAHDFVRAISEELGVDEDRAKAIAAEIKERVLEQVRRKLFVWGVDISSIETHGARPLDEILAEEEAVLGKMKRPAGESRPVSVSPLKTEEKETASEIKITKEKFFSKPGTEKTPESPDVKKDEKEKSKNPFIIFETKKSEGLGDGVKAPPKKLFPSFDFLKPKKEEKKSVKAEIKTPQEEKRTVHYSENRTPLSSTPVFEKDKTEKKKDDDVLNLETFEVEKKKENQN